MVLAEAPGHVPPWRSPVQEVAADQAVSLGTRVPLTSPDGRRPVRRLPPACRSTDFPFAPSETRDDCHLVLVAAINPPTAARPPGRRTAGGAHGPQRLSVHGERHPHHR